MPKSESLLENLMHKILWDFVTQIDHLIPARRLDLLLINHKREHVILWILPFWWTHRVKIKESKKIEYIDQVSKLKKNGDRKIDGITNCS